MSDLRDFFQGASNSIASNVSAPVDGIAWLLRKAGVPVPPNPMGGSDWMAEKGLTQQPQNRTAGLLGEFAGMTAPMVAAAKAPQIAKGLLSLEDKAMDMGRVALENHMLNSGMMAPMIRTPFGRIPETGKEIDTMHKTLSSQLERAGNNVQSGVSNVSGSRYLTVKRDDLPDLQVRFSNHGDRYTGQMPGGDLGERFSVDPSSGNTFEMAKQFLKDGGVSFKPTPKTPAPKYTYEQLQGMTGGVNPQEVEKIAKIMGWL